MTAGRALENLKTLGLVLLTLHAVFLSSLQRQDPSITLRMTARVGLTLEPSKTLAKAPLRCHSERKCFARNREESPPVTRASESLTKQVAEISPLHIGFSSKKI